MKKTLLLFSAALIGLLAPAAIVGATTSGAATGWWVPSTGPVEWQWYLAGALNTSNATQMGTNSTTAAGTPAPAPTVYDIDGVNNTAATVSALHAKGDHVVCYIEVGTAGNYGGDYTTYYNELSAAGDLGNKLSGYPEKFININAASAVSIVESIIKTECAGKGFDAVETDLDETFNNNEGTTGFTITQANEVSYLTTLANYMHGLGLGWIGKNFDDTGVQGFVNAVMPLADGVITEQCNQYKTCGMYSAFEGKKAIFNAEYSMAPSSFCAADNAAGINGVKFNVDLNGKTRIPCR